ncbi:MAG: penicillin acylase family protein [Rhodospirillaceae bacterium]|nr:penicillin acylase family protein [Rhodospirillaceae bacterium]
MSKRRTLILGLTGLMVLIIVGGSVALYRAASGSLPILDGEVRMAGLSGSVTIERDRYGVPTIRGGTREDVARATGFVHGQDRFFQMDLLRRSTAGELAALFGAAAADFDRQRRLHRLRVLARAVVERAAPGERALLEAYANGVNAGLEALSVAPFEYLILRAEPEPWRAEDIVLGNLAMFFELTDYDASRESGYARLLDGIPELLGRFVFAPGNRWDAPLVGDAWETPPVPGPDVCDLRGTRSLATGFGPQPDVHADLPKAGLPLDLPAMDSPFSRQSASQLDLPVAGSNSWAVAGKRTSTGQAMVANDMHLGLNLPNIWYRVRLVVTGDEPEGPPEEADTSPKLDTAGVTLPGTPLVVAGSNGSIAWGFTNSRGDWSDLVLIETDPANPGAYLTPDGNVPFDEYVEIIEIKGGESEAVTFRWTRWGPVVGTDHRGRLQALRWLAHVPEAVDLGISELETVTSVTEALALAPRVGIPPQNFVVADARGSIGWTIMGRVPRRVGYDSSLPASWADGSAGWHGWLAPDEYPRVVDPESGLIWTANNRIVDGEVLTHMGVAGYWLGARARQIRDALAAVARPRIEDMLAIQLDDRALLLQEWRDVLHEALAAGAGAPYPWADELKAYLQRWDGHAGTDSVSYRIVREFRRHVVEEVLSGILDGCGDFDGPVRLAATNQVEGPIWQLITEQPDHLLPPPHTSWHGLFVSAADSAVSTCGTGPLSECTWGSINQLDIRHPLAGVLRFLRPWLTIRGDPLPGGDHMPRIQQPDYGASERFAVAPGDEANGYFHMPGGQSGHPLSPFFSAGHDAWVRGEPLPYLPGPALHRLTLAPE